MKIMKIVLAAVVSLMITNPTSAVEFGENSWDLHNPYMGKPITIGTQLIYSGYGTKARIYSTTNILGTEVVDGVTCLRVNSIRTEKSNFSETWLAQDTSGNVYLLKLWEGENPVPVVLGKNGAVLFTPSSPKVGDTVFGDRTVVEVGVTVPMLSTGLGPFANCLKTVEPDGDIVYLAPGLGDVRKDYVKEQGGYELKEVIPGAGYSTIDDTLKITVHSLLYKGMQLDLTAVFEIYTNIADPSGLYWKLTELTQ
jgi:hypothetical protein